MTQQWTLTLGQTLRCVRIARGLTMDAVAEKSGHNQSSLSVIERDKVIPSASFLRDIAPFYGCPWWSNTHNISWLTMIATVASGTANSPSSNALHKYLNLGVRTRNILATAMAEDPTIAPLYRQCVEVFNLPGLTPLATAETAPLWAWIAEILAIDEELVLEGHDVPSQAKHILTAALAYFQENTIGISQPNMSRNLRAARLARHWSPDDLARNASKKLQLAGEDPIRGIDIDQMESDVGEVNILRWIAIAHALEVPLSQIMPTLASSTGDDIEEVIMQLLNQYGLAPRAVDVVKEMMQLLRSYEDRPRAPRP